MFPMTTLQPYDTTAKPLSVQFTTFEVSMLDHQWSLTLAQSQSQSNSELGQFNAKPSHARVEQTFLICMYHMALSYGNLSDFLNQLQPPSIAIGQRCIGMDCYKVNYCNISHDHICSILSLSFITLGAS